MHGPASSPASSQSLRGARGDMTGSPPGISAIGNDGSAHPIDDGACAECGGTSELRRMDDGGPLCRACGDLGHLTFLPAGDAALTRRAAKASSLSAVVVRWSRTRRRYERQGILVEDQALALAEHQCLSDEDARMRRRERDRARRAIADEEFQSGLAEQITRLFPGCPPGRAAAIAQHTGLRGSRRVGRSAAGRALDEDAITLAGVVSLLHQDTRYDSLLLSVMPRDAALDRVLADIDLGLAGWRKPNRTPSPAK